MQPKMIFVLYFVIGDASDHVRRLKGQSEVVANMSLDKNMHAGIMQCSKSTPLFMLTLLLEAVQNNAVLCHASILIFTICYFRKTYSRYAIPEGHIHKHYLFAAPYLQRPFVKTLYLNYWVKLQLFFQFLKSIPTSLNITYCLHRTEARSHNHFPLTQSWVLRAITFSSLPILHEEMLIRR